MTDKPLDRLYLECISDLADAVAQIRRMTGTRVSRTADNFELTVDEHMRNYDSWLEKQA